MENAYAIPADLARDVDKVRNLALLVGVAGTAALAAGYLSNPEQFFRSYLIAFIFWCGITLGCFAVMLLHHAAGGAWGLVIRRLLESATRLFPLMAILFLPIAFGMRTLYLWATPEKVLGDKVLEQKAGYLNVPFFLGRTALYFAIWILISYLINKWSLQQDREGPNPTTSKMRMLAGPGFLIYGFTITFSSVDWVMSLEPHWYSTIFGVLFMGGQGISAMCFVIAVAVLLAGRAPLNHVISKNHFHDLGKLLFAFVFLWTYFSFSQFLIIWSANQPEEIPFYISRLSHGWQNVALVILLLHSVLPFTLLLSRDLKRKPGRLMAIAMMVIVMRFVDLYWIAAPAYGHGHSGFQAHWLDIAAPVAMGGIWLAAYLWQLKLRPLMPINDPYLRKALEHGGHH